MNDMNESPDIVEQALRSSMKRRDFLTKAAAAGAITWATPMILSRAAYADDGGGGTARCRPSITVVCNNVTQDCGQGNKTFRGFKVTTHCGCSGTPKTCIKITGIQMCNNKTVVAYGNGTMCSPLQPRNGQPPDTILSTGGWVCFDSTQTVFLGVLRSGNGAISDTGGCGFTFTLGVWAGNCPDKASPSGANGAFNCQTFQVTMNADGSCSVQTAAQAGVPSLCPGSNPPSSPPCCPPNVTATVPPNTGSQSCCG